MLQMSSLWLPTSKRSDEGEIFHYAVGFLGGDLNPHWFGYGSFGMYLLWVVYLLLYPVMRLFGGVESMRLYAMQVFHNEFFLVTGRFVFALVAVLAVWLCVRMLRQMRVHVAARALAFALMTTSGAALLYANYIRTDYLVASLTLVVVYLAANSHKKSSLYAMAIVVPAAICSKISALPLGAMLAGYVIYRWWRKEISFRDVLGITIVCIGCLLLFQPYSNIFVKGWNMLFRGIEGYSPKNILRPENASDIGQRLATVYKYCKRANVHVYLWAAPLVAFARHRWRWALPAVAALLLSLAPYATSTVIRNYWFAPLFVLITFLGILGAYCFVELVAQKALPRRPKAWGWISVAALALFFGTTVGPRGYRAVSRNLTAAIAPRPERQSAQQWIAQNLLEKHQIVIDQTVLSGVTRVLDPGNHAASRAASRCFRYKRTKNKFLVSIFDEYLDNHYLRQMGVNAVKGVTTFNANARNKEYRKRLAGKYFVCRASYPKGFTKKGRTGKFADIYRFIASQKLVKTIRGTAIYYIAPDAGQQQAGEEARKGGLEG